MPGPADAIELVRKAREKEAAKTDDRRIKEAALGPNHVEVAMTLADWGNAYGNLGNAAKKEDLLERALRIKEAVLRRRGGPGGYTSWGCRHRCFHAGDDDLCVDELLRIQTVGKERGIGRGLFGKELLENVGKTLNYCGIC